MKRIERLQRVGQPFWQTESYDHLIRDEVDSARCCGYTTLNPVNARLCSRPEDWKWSSLYCAAPESEAPQKPHAGDLPCRSARILACG